MSDAHSEAHIEEHSSFIKTWQQLVVVVVLAFVVPIAIIVMLAKLVTTTGNYGEGHPAMTDEAVAARIKPVGRVELLDASAPKVVRSGKEVTDQACAACHTTGALNAPKIGDTAAWGKLIKEGLDSLTQTAIKGIRGMPARGGNPDLSDLEIARAIVYMANQSGGALKEPAAPPTDAPAAGAAPAAAAKK